MLLYCAARGGLSRRWPAPREWRDLALIAFLLLVIGNGTLTWSEQWVPAGLASMVIASAPFWMVFFARLEGEALRPRALIGLGAGFLGMLVLLWPDLRRHPPGTDFSFGVFMLCLATGAWAYGSVYVKRHQPRADPVLTIALQQLVGGVCLGVFGLLRGEAARWAPDAVGWGAIVYLAVFGTMVGYTAYIYALERLPTDLVSVYAYANPVVAVALGVLMLGERLDVFMLLGVPLVLAGIYLVKAADAGAEKS